MAAQRRHRVATEDQRLALVFVAGAHLGVVAGRARALPLGDRRRRRAMDELRAEVLSVKILPSVRKGCGRIWDLRAGMLAQFMRGLL